LNTQVFGRIAAVGVFITLAAAPLLGQEKEEEIKDAKDPWTLEDPGVIEEAGVISYGPFEVGDKHGSRKVEEVLGGLKVLWMETEHFKIGSTLGSYKIPSGEKTIRTKIREELLRLEDKLPELKAKKTKVLDPWLRLHVWAQRLEDIHQTVSTLLGVDDDSFPRSPGLSVGGKYMGEGKHFGMKDKFVVLLFDKQSAIARYFGRFAGISEATPRRYTWVNSGSMLFATSPEFGDGYLNHDTRLHCHVAFNVAQNLLAGYKYFNYSLPVWLPEGIAHCIERDISPKYNNYSYVEESSQSLRQEWNWAPKVRGRVKNEIAVPSEKMLSWMDYNNLKFTNHLNVWSRVDFLIDYDKTLFAQFVDGVKGRIKGVPTNRIATSEEILAQQNRVFQEVYGWSHEDFDDAWGKWVLKNYPKK